MHAVRTQCKNLAKGGDQLLEEDATDDEVVTTTHIRLKKGIKKRYPFEKQPFPDDEPMPRAEDGREYVQTKGGPALIYCAMKRLGMLRDVARDVEAATLNGVNLIEAYRCHRAAAKIL